MLSSSNVFIEMVKNGNIKKLAEVTSQSVEKATGSSWDEWVAFLDRSGAEKMEHKKIVDLLKQENVMPWWQQKVASGYRLHKGLRGAGQSDNIFQAGVSKVFPLTLQQAWDFITSPEIIEVWNAGNIAEEDIKVYNPGSHLRVAWKMKGWKKAGVMQIRVTARSADKHKTTISLLLTTLPDEDLRNEMKLWLKQTIDQLRQAKF